MHRPVGAVREEIARTTNNIDQMKMCIGAAVLLPALLGACSGSGQEVKELKNDEVPLAVRDAFAKQFPHAAKVAWEAEDANTYGADFQEESSKRSAIFAPDGTWLGTESSIAKGALAEAVINAIAAQYPDHEVEKAERVETPEGLSYEVELEHKEHTVEVRFAEDGKLISSKVEEDGEKEEEDDRSTGTGGRAGV